MNEHEGQEQHALQREMVLTDEMRLKLMRLFEANPRASQRDAAREFGISVGKVNYCLRALVHRGWIKANRFCNSRNKIAYRYLLTPRGIEAKTALAVRFLRIKVREYETLRTEIEQLRREASSASRQGRTSQT
jgi:EPS-associated MarR family transcriptional regulator